MAQHVQSHVGKGQPSPDPGHSLTMFYSALLASSVDLSITGNLPSRVRPLLSPQYINLIENTDASLASTSHGSGDHVTQFEIATATLKKPNKTTTRRGPMDEMRQMVRILIQLMPESIRFLDIGPDYSKNRVSEAAIKVYLQRTIGNQAPHPEWGLPGGWPAYLAHLFSWAVGRTITREDAMTCATRAPGRSWVAVDSALANLGLDPKRWPLPLTLQGIKDSSSHPSGALCRLDPLQAAAMTALQDHANSVLKPAVVASVVAGDNDGSGSSGNGKDRVRNAAHGDQLGMEVQPDREPLQALPNGIKRNLEAAGLETELPKACKNDQQEEVLKAEDEDVLIWHPQQGIQQHLYPYQHCPQQQQQQLAPHQLHQMQQQPLQQPVWQPHQLHDLHPQLYPQQYPQQHHMEHSVPGADAHVLISYSDWLKVRHIISEGVVMPPGSACASAQGLLTGHCQFRSSNSRDASSHGCGGVGCYGSSSFDNCCGGSGGCADGSGRFAEPVKMDATNHAEAMVATSTTTFGAQATPGSCKAAPCSGGALAGADVLLSLAIAPTHVSNSSGKDVGEQPSQEQPVALLSHHLLLEKYSS